MREVVIPKNEIIDICAAKGERFDTFMIGNGEHLLSKWIDDGKGMFLKASGSGVPIATNAIVRTLENRYEIRIVSGN